jgi:hypothetical protein
VYNFSNRWDRLNGHALYFCVSVFNQLTGCVKNKLYHKIQCTAYLICEIEKNDFFRVVEQNYAFCFGNKEHVIRINGLIHIVELATPHFFHVFFQIKDIRWWKDEPRKNEFILYQKDIVFSRWMTFRAKFYSLSKPKLQL